MAVMEAAAPIPPRDRDKFLRDVAAGRIFVFALFE
jgi:hypothetical protein